MPAFSRRRFLGSVGVTAIGWRVPAASVLASQPAALPSSGSFTDIGGVRVGHFTHARRPTGCTAILFDKPATAGVDYDGSAPAESLGVMLQPVSPLDQIHGILFAGSGPMGLGATAGAVRYLEEQHVGYDWGVPNVRDARQQAHIKAMYMLTKSLDSTRLVIDNDGWEHTDSTDLFAVHDYSRTGDLFYERFKTVQEGKIPVPYQGKMFLAPGFQYNCSPIFLSEFGGISYVPPETHVPVNSWGYEGMERTEAGTLERMRGLYEAVAKLPKIIGICYTQLTDVEQEVNGLLTYDRRPKFDVEAVRAINGLLK